MGKGIMMKRALLLVALLGMSGCASSFSLVTPKVAMLPSDITIHLVPVKNACVVAIEIGMATEEDIRADVPIQLTQIYADDCLQLPATKSYKLPRCGVWHIGVVYYLTDGTTRVSRGRHNACGAGLQPTGW